MMMRGLMSQIRFVCIAVLLLLYSTAIAGQASAQAPAATRPARRLVPSTFGPLDRWKNAVLLGDRAAIAAFYSTSPTASAKTPQGETQDPGEEPAFWATLRSRASGSIDLKILEIKAPRPDARALVLRLETKVHTDAGEKPGLVSFSQVWGNVNGSWRILRTQRGDLVAIAPPRLPQPVRPNVQLYPDPAEAQSEIQSALDAAGKDHKRVILIFGGNWCYDCHVLDATFHDQAIAPLVVQGYHVVHINIGDYDRNLEVAKKYEVPLNKGVPSLAVLDSDGKLVVSQQSGEFENTGRIGPEDVVLFLKRWMPQR
jgi:thioredoxin 1